MECRIRRARGVVERAAIGKVCGMIRVCEGI
jgi:hypothetical protein